MTPYDLSYHLAPSIFITSFFLVLFHMDFAMRRMQTLLIIFLYILGGFLTNSAPHGPSSSTSSNEVEIPFFHCLSSVEMNYTTPYDQNYHHIFNSAAYNLRISKSLSSKPIAIILPESKEQLSTTIICCKKLSLSFTIRSGGHSYEGSSYSSANPVFVMIDLMNIRKVSINLDSKTAWVEGGATLGEIYNAVGKYSNHLGFPAGLWSTVGSGGHISGGGYGIMVRKYGLAADNVVDALLVDADGRIFDRKTMEEDVFWAIRGGGGGSWGAIYSWKIQLVDVPETVSAFNIRRHASVKKAAMLLEKWQVVAPDLEDEFTLMVFAKAESETSLLLNFQGLYLGPKSSALALMNSTYPELDLVANECNDMSWVESMAYFQGISVDDLKKRFMTSDQLSYSKWKSDFVREKISTKGIEGILNMLMMMPKGGLALFPLGGMMARIESDASPFPRRERNRCVLVYAVGWDEEKGCDACLDWINTFYQFMTPFVSHGPRAAYVNVIDFDLGIMDWANHNISADEFVELGRVWGEKYFLRNYDRLVRAKTLIDPGNLFRHQQSIPPLPCQDHSFQL